MQQIFAKKRATYNSNNSARFRIFFQEHNHGSKPQQKKQQQQPQNFNNAFFDFFNAITINNSNKNEIYNENDEVHFFL